MLYSEHVFKYQCQHRDKKNWVQTACFGINRLQEEWKYMKVQGKIYMCVFCSTPGETENRSLASITISSGADTHQAATQSMHKKQKY